MLLLSCRSFRCLRWGNFKLLLSDDKHLRLSAVCRRNLFRRKRAPPTLSPEVVLNCGVGNVNAIASIANHDLLLFAQMEGCTSTRTLPKVNQVMPLTSTDTEPAAWYIFAMMFCVDGSD